MIGKLLQNISNGISFAKSGKEEFMIVFDELIAQYSEKMTAYLRVRPSHFSIWLIGPSADLCCAGRTLLRTS
jgi:hypothetical protein